MSSPAQRKATQNYRNRLAQQGIIRFEVQAPEADRALFRALASRLVGGTPEAQQTRLAVQKILCEKPSKAEGTLRTARRPPLVEKEPDFGDLFDSSSKGRS